MPILTESRKTQVYIKNLTGQDIGFAGIAHKYSSVFKDQGAIKEILKNGETSPAVCEVNYNVGAATTGVDWWYIHFATIFGDSNITHIYEYSSSPNNFRGIIDFFEKNVYVPLYKVLPLVYKVAGTVIPAGKPAFKAAEFVSKMMSKIVNSESTAGFKRHILKDSDKEEGLTIELHPSGKIRLVSASGVSETVYTLKNTKSITHS